jgi:hypothetical protein
MPDQDNELMAGMSKIYERILQQGIVRFEVLDQNFLFNDGPRQILKMPAKLNASQIIDRYTRVPQRVDSVVQVINGADQRIIIGKQAYTGLQQITLKRRIIPSQGIEGVKSMLT